MGSIQQFRKFVFNFWIATACRVSSLLSIINRDLSWIANEVLQVNIPHLKIETSNFVPHTIQIKCNCISNSANINNINNTSTDRSFCCVHSGLPQFPVDEANLREVLDILLLTTHCVRRMVAIALKFYIDNNLICLRDPDQWRRTPRSHKELLNHIFFWKPNSNQHSEYSYDFASYANYAFPPIWGIGSVYPTGQEEDADMEEN